MSVMTIRGGIPSVRRLAVTSGVAPLGGEKVRTPFDIQFLIIRVTGNPCHMYFTEQDYELDENYVEVPIPSASTPYGEWSGPVETNNRSQHSEIWLRGNGGTSNVELVVFQRRG